MKKVITYGTFDYLHFGHINLLKQAKALGDYLIVGVTSDDFDKERGKINVKQSLVERIEAVKNTGIPDEIIVEEYQGQKIDDIKRYNVDIFTVGSDWKGNFDYLNEYCQVVYLDRTEGVSSSQIRNGDSVRLGLVGDDLFLNKICNECRYVNGIDISGIATSSVNNFCDEIRNLPLITDSYDDLLEHIDAVYLISHPKEHYVQIKKALMKGIHVLCETPLTLNSEQCIELKTLAKQNGCVLMDALKTAYSTAYSRMLLLLKSGIIGNVVSVDATCTSLRIADKADICKPQNSWSSVYMWGPTAMLPIFQVLGVNYSFKQIMTAYYENTTFDYFTKIDFVYDNAVASVKVGTGVKSEGELIISGTKGYVYVPAPWWKTDYFEVRFENQSDNKRYFYQLDGEGIRYELLAFLNSIEQKRNNDYISDETSSAIIRVLEDYYNDVDVVKLCTHI